MSDKSPKYITHDEVKLRVAANQIIMAIRKSGVAAISFPKKDSEILTKKLEKSDIPDLRKLARKYNVLNIVNRILNDFQ